MACIHPLQEAATTFAGVITQRQGEMATFLKEATAKLEQPILGLLVEELKAKYSQATMTVAERRERHQELRQKAQQEMQQG